MKIAVVIPAYNEEKTIRSVLWSLKDKYHNIIVVDDGSDDATGEIARGEGALVCIHLINRGLGGALGTGITKALQLGADIIVTFDADEQHRVEDISGLIEPIQLGEADVVIGSRILTASGMPFIRRLYNLASNIITYLLFGMKVSDSQSGLRAFNKKAAGLLQLRANRMEVSSEIIREIKVHDLKYKEVPIKAIYTKYSLSKGQSFVVGVKTLIKLIVLRILK